MEKLVSIAALAILLGAFLIVPGSEAQATSPLRSLVIMTISNPYNFSLSDYPCFATLYFSEGQVYNNTLTIVSSNGVPVPFQITAETEYPDGSLDMAQVVFAGNVSARSKAQYLAVAGRSGAGEPQISYESSNGEQYIANNGVFSFYVNREGTPDIYDLYVHGQSPDAFGLPFAQLFNQLSSYGPTNATVNLIINGPEMSEFLVNETHPMSASGELIVFRGYPVIYYKLLRATGSGAWRPILGYMNSSLFSDLAYRKLLVPLASIGATGEVFPETAVYSFEGKVPISFASNSSFQFFAAGVSAPVLAYAYQADAGSFDGFIMPGIGLTGATELYEELIQPPELVVQEPPATLSVTAPPEAQVFQQIAITVNLFFPSNQSSVILIPHLPKGIVVVSPGRTNFTSVVQGSEATSQWVVYANRTGDLSGSFQVGPSVVNFSVNFYVQPLLPSVSVVLKVLSGNLSLAGAHLAIYGSGVSQNLITNSSGEANTTLPMGVYSVSVAFDDLQLGSHQLSVFSPGVYYIKTRSFGLTVIPVFENGAPMSGNSMPLVLVYGKGGIPELSSVASYENGVVEAQFYYLPPGVYYVQGMMWGLETKPMQVYLNGSAVVKLPMPDLDPLDITVLDVNGRPLPGALVQIYGPEGIFLAQETTSSQGLIGLAVPASNYTYVIDYDGYTVAQGSVSVKGPTSVTAKAEVSLSRIEVASPFGPVADAKVEIVSPSGQRIFFGITNSSGELAAYIPKGNFTVEASTPIYSAYAIVSAPISAIHLNAGFGSSILLLAGLTVLAWAGYVTAEVKGGVKKEEISKLKSMLEKLDDLYQAGEVDFALYNKLKDEYQGRLAELTKHEE
ncbi:MAG: carboxypeptidase-like regulatory domain-containing protein [TACK group archaeon]|nr:carboxypeptidase-like regulatory domain-containing protein [TACK group archaeon]